MDSYLGKERSDENEEDVIHKQEAQQNHTDLCHYGKRDSQINSRTEKKISIF